MKKVCRTVVTVVTGLALVAAPVAGSILLAERLSVHMQSGTARLLADEILRRSEETSRQAQGAIDTLVASHTGPACSVGEIALMRKLAINASNLQGVGRIDGTRLVCSSLGDHGAGLELGAPDYINRHGTSMRIAARLALAPQSTFIVAASRGYAVIIHQDLVLDVPGYSADTALAVVGSNAHSAICARGNFDPAWMRPLAEGEAQAFAAGGGVVAVRRSGSYELTAVAAISGAAVTRKSRELMLFLTPTGLLLGLALAWAGCRLNRRREALPAMLRAALVRDEFFLVYQPIVRLDTGQCIGAEALLRWRRRDGSLISPDRFIPIAEQTGIITGITARVLALVEREAPAMVAVLPHLRVSVNLSSRDLQSAAIVQQLNELMQRSGIRPGNLVVEATEGGFIDTALATGVIEAIRRAGIGVAVDDFGTGYSCLSYLTSLDLDFLKIDKSFISPIGTAPGADSVLLHIIEMAKSLRLGMVAEGVKPKRRRNCCACAGSSSRRAGCSPNPCRPPISYATSRPSR